MEITVKSIKKQKRNVYLLMTVQLFLIAWGVVQCSRGDMGFGLFNILQLNADFVLHKICDLGAVTC